MTIDELKQLDHVNVSVSEKGMATVTCDDGYCLAQDVEVEVVESTPSTDEAAEVTEAKTKTQTQYVSVLYCMAPTKLPTYYVVSDSDRSKQESKSKYGDMTLEEAKAELTKQIEEYDQSDSVNQFYVNGVGVWFEPSERATIQRGVESCQKLGRTSYEVTYGGKQLSIPCDTALTVLAQIEVYALDCLSVTNNHKTKVNALTSVADVEGYDYKSGYPEKLSFTI